MHQSFRDGFEKIGFVWSDAAAVKSQIQAMGSAATPESIKNYVKKMRGIKEDFGQIRQEKAKHVFRKQMKELNPHGTGKPNWE